MWWWLWASLQYNNIVHVYVPGQILIELCALLIVTPLQANMFQHTQRRMELGHEQQRDMEQAFEGLFIKTHG